MGASRDRQQLGYLLALEVTNLRLGVELARSAMRLGRWGEALEHLEECEAPARRQGTGQGGPSATGYKRDGGSVGPAAGDPRWTRPSLLVEVVRERVRRRLREEEAQELVLDEWQLTAAAAGEAEVRPSLLVEVVRERTARRRDEELEAEEAREVRIDDRQVLVDEVQHRRTG